jgi:hypothetical protein
VLAAKFSLYAADFPCGVEISTSVDVVLDPELQPVSTRINREIELKVLIVLSFI